MITKTRLTKLSKDLFTFFFSSMKRSLEEASATFDLIDQRYKARIRMMFNAKIMNAKQELKCLEAELKDVEKLESPLKTLLVSKRWLVFPKEFVPVALYKNENERVYHSWLKVQELTLKYSVRVNFLLNGAIEVKRKQAVDEIMEDGVHMIQGPFSETPEEEVYFCDSQWDQAIMINLSEIMPSEALFGSSPYTVVDFTIPVVALKINDDE